MLKIQVALNIYPVIVSNSAEVVKIRSHRRTRTSALTGALGPVFSRTLVLEHPPNPECAFVVRWRAAWMETCGLGTLDLGQVTLGKNASYFWESQVCWHHAWSASGARDSTCCRGKEAQALGDKTSRGTKRRKAYLRGVPTWDGASGECPRSYFPLPFCHERESCCSPLQEGGADSCNKLWFS